EYMERRGAGRAASEEGGRERAGRKPASGRDSDRTLQARSPQGMRAFFMEIGIDRDERARIHGAPRRRTRRERGGRPEESRQEAGDLEGFRSASPGAFLSSTKTTPDMPCKVLTCKKTGSLSSTAML
ncbi:MAG: hypothetical protein ACOCVC_04205, partial [Spirochaeta sp.]